MLAGARMPDQSRSARIAWLVLALNSIANFGNFYVYDSIGPVADLLEQQRHFTDTQIGWLNAIYSLPNVVLILVGGVMVDRLGAARMLFWTAASVQILKVSAPTPNRKRPSSAPS